MATAKPDRQTQELLHQLSERGLPAVATLSPEEARKSRNPVFEELGGPPESVERVDHLKIPGLAGNIPLRIYIPQGTGSFPILVYFHGGGWVIGTLDTHDNLCRSLAKNTPCVVISVDYRLAPENPFPAALQDAYAATLWAAKHADKMAGDGTRIAVGGDSAGGNLAAAVSLMARDQGEPSLSYQLLIYPVLNLASFDTGSYREHGEGYILTKESMEYYRSHYLKDEKDALDPHASPLLAEDLAGLPPAMIVTAECDVLTEESQAYAGRLSQAGVPTTYRCYEGMIHPFVSFLGPLDKAREAVQEMSSELQGAFGI